jgi:hypothetical protein
MKKISTLFAVAFAAALWFTGCEQGLEFAKPSESSASFERNAAVSIIPGASSGGTRIGGAALNAAPGAPTSWTEITDSVFTSTFSSVSIWAVSAAGDTVVAGGDKGLSAYSTDSGQTWTALPISITQGNTINGIANDGKETFVMVAFNGVLAYTTSGPAGKWTTLGPTDTQINGTIYAAAYGTQSGRFVIGGNQGEAAYASVNNLNSWMVIKDLQPIFAAGNSSNIRSISSVPSERNQDIFVAVGGRGGPAPMPNAAAYSLSSGSNNTWVSKTNNVFSRGLTTDGNNFVASGYDMANYNVTYIAKTDLAPTTTAWNPIDLSTTGVKGWLNCITYGAGYYVAGGVDGHITYTNVLNQTTAWKAFTLFPGYVNGLCFAVTPIYGSRFYAVGDSGKGAYTIGVITETVGATGNGSSGISVNVN